MCHKQKLPQRITLARSISMIMGSVLGSGLLILPGLVYHLKGVYSFWSWLAMSLFIIPFLFIFTKIGRDFPSAGGVISFIQNELPSFIGNAITYIMLISMIILVPVVAVIGANYIGFIGSFSHTQILLAAIMLLTFSTILNIYNPELTLKVQGISAIFLLIFLVILICIGISKSSAEFIQKLQAATFNDPKAVSMVIGGMALVFWAFLGWENLSFATEEFIDIRRILSKATIISYVIMTSLYIGLSAAVIGLLDPAAEMTSKAPLAAMIREAIGYWGGVTAAIISSLLMVLNVNAWVWGPSRLVFAAARKGLIYKPLSIVGKHGTPAFALLSLLIPYIIILLIMLVQQSFMFETLISIVNANFIFLYLLTILAFTKYYKSITDYIMSAIAFVLTLYLFVQFGVFAAICLGFFAIMAMVMIYWSSPKRSERIFLNKG